MCSSHIFLVVFYIDNITCTVGNVTINITQRHLN
uniref:Uncharacterized protein n=1 Tax=Anguilla anguilla TaxID=7936 RepID=A0A0E9XZZ2_ANGAN